MAVSPGEVLLRRLFRLQEHPAEVGRWVTDDRVPVRPLIR
jgi:hypothetical protein